MKLFTAIIGLLLFLACEKETSKQNTSTELEEVEASQVLRVTKKEVESIRYLDYGLNSATKKAVVNWATYSELETLITSIRSADLSYFEGDNKIMQALIKDLKATIPENVSSQSIIARITALETKFYKLKSAVQITNTPKKELLEAVKEFLQACSNLNLQMNKKLEKEAQNISKSNL